MSVHVTSNVELRNYVRLLLNVDLRYYVISRQNVIYILWYHAFIGLLLNILVLSCLMYWPTLLWSQTIRGEAHGLV